MRVLLRILLAAPWLMLLAVATQASGQASGRVVVFAPSSMTDVMGQIAELHEARTGDAVLVSFASTAQIARQLDAGAPADVFVTADKEWMDWASERKLVSPDSLITFGGNTLVVATTRPDTGESVPQLLEADRFAMGDPETVPAGRYAREALTAGGWWSEVQRSAVFGENVRVSLRLAARGEVGAAIVYATDARLEPGLRVAHVFAEDSHAPIRYLAAETAQAAPTGAAFLETLEGEDTRSILTQAGFTVPPVQP